MNTNAKDWACPLCNRSDEEIGQHPLPIRQFAHTLPNRLTALDKRRNGGVKNALKDDERNHLFELLNRFLGTSSWVRFASHGVHLCGECHEEILSEPIYLPAAHKLLAPLFAGRTRVEKIALLAAVILAGAKDVSGAAARGNSLQSLLEQYATESENE
jgi:hypothetical protein